MKRNRVNVLTVVNSDAKITTETIDGKPHIVVRGVTPVVDDKASFPTSEKLLVKLRNQMARLCWWPDRRSGT